MGSSLELQRQLLRRLQRVVRQWPEDPSRKGRDFGEFLRKRYVQRFEEELKKNVSRRVRLSSRELVYSLLNMRIYAHMHSHHVQPSHAEMAVSSLERLSSNYHRKQYPREKEYSYSEGLVASHPSALSNGGEILSCEMVYYMDIYQGHVQVMGYSLAETIECSYIAFCNLPSLPSSLFPHLPSFLPFLPPSSLPHAPNNLSASPAHTIRCSLGACLQTI